MVGEEAKAGIENSVRVAFAQVGRVEADTEDPGTITGIDCAGTGVLLRFVIKEMHKYGSLTIQNTFKMLLIGIRILREKNW